MTGPRLTLVAVAPSSPGNSGSAFLINGTVNTAGTGTTNFPHLFIQPTGTAAVTSWSTGGTGLGMNLASGFAGNFIDCYGAGVGKFTVSATGIISTVGNISTSQGLTVGAAGFVQFSTRSVFRSASDGVIKISNSAETDFGRLQFGGTTASFPALRRTTTGLDFRLADDSAYTSFTALSSNFTAAVTDATTYTFETYTYGGNSHSSTVLGQTTTGVTTSAVTILTTTRDGTLATVCGSDGTNKFSDVVLVGTADTPFVIATHTSAGAPAARTYSNTAGALKVLLASGTYAINVTATAAGQR